MRKSNRYDFKNKSINIYTAGGKVSIPAINKEQVEFFNYIVQERV